ncbi:histidine-binding periplasmic protein-like isoform X2 [Ptychodera flava]|uniref:histidine-binding periplasmic protein-like isoform X2 n=1 Tax=Ptychodera flava TaxID=63121 RepID=UPI00396A7322
MAGIRWILTVACVCSFSHVVICTYSKVLETGVYEALRHQVTEQFLGQNELKMRIGSRFDRSGAYAFLGAVTSDRVPPSTVRARLARYTNDLDRYLGHSLTMAAVKMMNNRRDQLVQTLLFLRILQDELEEIVHSIEKSVHDRAYIFQVESLGNYSIFYTDDEGRIQGFFVDLIHEVCKEEGKSCKLQDHPFSYCLTSTKDGDQIIGKGLLARQLDACFIAQSRQLNNILSFTDPVWEYTGSARFYVKEGNTDKFDTTDITGKKIVFIEGWHSNYRCLIGHNVVGANSTKFKSYIVDIPYLPQFLKKNEVDAVFAQEVPTANGGVEIPGGTPEGFKAIGSTMYCTQGVGLATRKDSNVTNWFNEALRKMKRSGKFAALCQEAEMKHGQIGPIDCKY